MDCPRFPAFHKDPVVFRSSTALQSSRLFKRFPMRATRAQVVAPDLVLHLTIYKLNFRHFCKDFDIHKTHPSGYCYKDTCDKYYISVASGFICPDRDLKIYAGEL